MDINGTQSSSNHFFLDNLEHHLVDPVDHALWVTFQPSLEAGVIEQLPNNKTGLLGIVFSVIIQFKDQLVILIVLKSYISQLRSWFTRLNNNKLTFACSSINDFMKAICLIALEIGLITNAGPSILLFDTTTLST